MHLIIFSPILTPRIKYVFNFIFKDILKTEVEFTGNSQYFSQSDHIKISYAEKPLGDELFFKSSPLLLSSKVEDFNIRTTTFGEFQVPFPIEGSSLPFDIFAASFFILSRYEEYLHQQKSNEDFKAVKSLQHKLRLLDKPVIDGWALILKNLIRKKHPSFKFQEKTFSHQPAINFRIHPGVPDGFILKTKFFFQSIFKKDMDYLSTKFDQLTGLSVNIEQVIPEVEKSFANRKNKPLYFVDFPNVSTAFLKKDKVSTLLKGKSVGLLRPCADERQKVNDIKAALLKLKKLHPQQVNLMSQQLEILKFPTCYLNLLNSGIVSDYSMGYADTPGFRAGTCTPFNWYDLELDKVTALHIKSYCISDTALEYMPLDQAKKVLHNYIDAVKFVDGYFYSNWQLRNLSNNLKFKKLKTLFNELLNYTVH